MAHALRAFARAHLEIDKEKRCASNEMRPDVQVASDLKKRIIGELSAVGNDVLLFESAEGAKRFVKLKYNRSSRVVTFQNVNNVVEGIGIGDLRTIATLEQLKQVVSDRIHQLRVVKTPTFNITNKAPKTHTGDKISVCSSELKRAVEQYETVDQKIKQRRTGLADKCTELNEIISRSTQDVADFMQNRAANGTTSSLLDGSNEFSPTSAPAPAPVRVDIAQRGTYFVRQKTSRTPCRPETIKKIVAMTEKTFSDLDADRLNFRTWFEQNRGQVARKLFDNLVEERRNTATGDVRFALDKTTTNRT